jgi:type II secretory pathway pseudopilin PulG
MLMPKRRNIEGITLVELLVVMVLFAMIAGLAGPPMGRILDKLQLQRTASDLATQFRKASAAARAAQAPIAAIYGNHEFRFIRNTDRVATFKLPASIAPAAPGETTAILFLPSGQIVGGDQLQLHDEQGRAAIIRMSFLDGISITTVTTR